MKKIAIFTTSRADFGLFTPLIKEIKKQNGLSYSLFAGGAHLASECGTTVREIEKFNFNVTATFDFLLNRNTSEGLAKSVSIATFELSNIFEKYVFDFVCILGDRFELMPIVINSILFRKPIIHIHGGEKSEGAIDEQIRHMITKAAHIHFTACEEYAQNIRNMGEPTWRIFNTGALGIDNIIQNLRIPKKQLFESLNLDINKDTVLLTYHPVTLEFSIQSIKQIKNIFSVLKKYNFQLVITAPNVEVGREQIGDYIKQEVSKDDNYHYITSLGILKYHSLIPCCKFVIGNSSSGIVEVPYFKIPTVNIGDRQKGRIRHQSIIDTDYTVESIANGIEKALSQDFNKNMQMMHFKFGDGKTAKRMVGIIKKIKINQAFLRKELIFKGE